MAFCPGSKNIRNPTPEYVPCPECGYEVEIWTKELMRPCPQCSTRVLRQQQASCIDWCPYAKECVGPEVYASLKPATTKASGPIESLQQEHEAAQTQVGLLKGAGLCLRAATRGGSQAQGVALRGRETLEAVLGFLEGELQDHFRKEEKGLFPLLEARIGRDGGPIANMLREHQEIKSKTRELARLAAGLSASGPFEAANAAIEALARLLQGHIDKENTALLPIAQAALGDSGLAELSTRWEQLQKVGT